MSEEKFVGFQRFDASTCNSSPTPMSLNEKLSKEDGKDKFVHVSISKFNRVIYAINIRLDIINPVSIISMFIGKPNEIEPRKLSVSWIY